jgi:hypothetical protein
VNNDTALTNIPPRESHRLGEWHHTKLQLAYPLKQNAILEYNQLPPSPNKNIAQSGIVVVFMLCSAVNTSWELHVNNLHMWDRVNTEPTLHFALWLK